MPVAIKSDRTRTLRWALLTGEFEEVNLVCQVVQVGDAHACNGKQAQ